MDCKERMFILFLVFMSMARNDGVPLPKVISLILMVCGVMCWVYVMMSTTFTKRERVCQFILLALAAISVGMNRHLGTLLACMVIVSMKDVDLKKALWAILYIQIITIVINDGIFIAGIIAGDGIRGYYQQRNVMGVLSIEEQYRVYFGTLHPNGTQKLICLISVLLLYLRYDHLKASHIIILTLLNILFYFLTFSNTGLLLWFLSAFVIYWVKAHVRWIDWIGKAGPFIFCALVGVVLYGSFHYSEQSVVAVLNRWITGRFLCAYQHIAATGLSAWGKEMNPIMSGVDLDCAYINILLFYGYIVFSGYCIGCFGLLVTLKRQGRYLDIIILLILHCFFVIESFIMVIYMNWTFLYMGRFLYEGLDYIKKRNQPVISA